MVDFAFYTDIYHGCSITEQDFPLMVSQAQAKLDQYKRKYTVTAPEETSEAMAVCAMADTLAYFIALQNGAAPVVSAAIGSVSVSYRSAGSSTAETSGLRSQERELYSSACQYLDIYRGVG